MSDDFRQEAAKILRKEFTQPLAVPVAPAPTPEPKPEDKK